MIRRLASLTAVAVALVLSSVAPSPATTVVPVAESDLAAQAAAVVLGRVTAIQSHLDSGRGQIFTDITLAVDEVLAGPALPGRITIRQPGGRVGGLESWIEGSPEFIVGERVLVFVRVAGDGTLRVLHLYLGKFSVMIDPLTGHDVALRITGAGVRVLPPLRPDAAPAPKDTHELNDLRRTIRALRGPAPPPAQAAPMQTAPTVGSAVVEQHDAFVFNGGTPARWFEPDAGQAITMFLNSSGEPAAPTQGFDQARQAMAAWSNDPQSNFRYADGGFTTAAGFRLDGVNAVSWNDPDNAMAPPSNCTGVLGMGGFYRSTTESRVVNGTTFWRILEGDVVINNGWEGCGFYESFLNFAEVLTHELGHVLGLGHSSDTTATMYASAHFDGRGASIKADDLAGLRFVYPMAPLRLAFSAPTSGATVSGTITLSLAAAGGIAPYSYQVWLDGTTIGSSASFAWNTATTADGGHTLSATLTDSGGRTASASISVTVANSTPPPPGGTLRVAITQPSSGATVSGVPWAVMWVDGQSGSSNTFTLTLAGQTMGTTTTASRGPVSMPYDTRTVVNGSQPLTATVRDATGNTGSATVTLNVNNAGAPPPITASFTSPAAGAVVSGTVTVDMAVSGSTAASKTFRLSVEGTLVSTQTVAGTTASYAWNTASVGNGSRTLSLSVTDANGASSANVTRTVSVQNAGPLTASITAPANGATVAGPVTITVAASGGTSPYSYAFSVDGKPATSGASASYSWNSTTVPDGAHTLGVTVTDTVGGSASPSINVTVSNDTPPPPPPPPPTGTLKVYVTNPSSGATVSGTNWVTLWLNGASGSSNTYTLSVGGQTVATSTTSSTGPVSMPWSTFAVADGPQTLTASAVDATSNTGAASIPITVNNGSAPPPPPPPLAASFTSPASGATVSGMVTVGMSASGGTAPYTYTLTIDGGQVATGASASYSWNTAGVVDGAHTLGLTVTDGAARTAAASRTVTVSNAAPPPPGGTLKVFITSPSGGATVSGTVWVNIWVDGAVSGNKVFTLRAGGTTVISATDAGVHVTLPWNTPGTPNGATTLSATVQDASANSGSASIPVTVGN